MNEGSIGFVLGLTIGLGVGLGVTWWRWKMATQLIDRATVWRSSATRTLREVRKQKRYLVRLDETLGTLAERVKVHLRITTPPHAREVVARMVGQTAPDPPQAGWETPIPKFEDTKAKKSPLPRGA